MRGLALAFALFAAPALAVQPDEMLADPALEARAREISTGLRCLVCRNESIDESSADLARDLRLLVRERVVAGDSDDEVLAFLTDRYGEFVLLRPRADGANLILWLAGPTMLVAGLALAALTLRLRPVVLGSGNLTEAENARLAELTREEGLPPGRGTA